MQTLLSTQGLMHRCRKLAWTACLASTLLPGTVLAGSFDLWGINTRYSLILTYSLAVRTEAPDDALINGPIDPFELHLDQAADGKGFTHTGLPTTINQDDGNRNFKKGSLINNRLSALAEVQFKWKNYGAQFSGNIFYDDVYRRQNNDNNSPDTINKRSNAVNEFSDAAQYYNGRRAKLLDAYIYGNWIFNSGYLLNVRIGQQLVAWGQSLFFPGISGAQSTADATKAFVPGAEVKDILLPTPQVYVNLASDLGFSLMAYYKFDFQPNNIFPVGAFYSPTDSVGPGAEFSYGAVNPLYLDGCPGLLGALSSLCQLGGAGTALNAPPNILIPYEGVIKASDKGQYGIGGKYQLTPLTSVGLYYLRYTDPNPAVVQYSGYPVIATFPITLTTQVLNQPTAVSYKLKYFEDIEMYAASYSTVLGPFNVAGEVSYRKGAPMGVQVLELGTINPAFVRGDVVQALSSLIYSTNPHLWFNTVSAVAEVGYLRVIDTDRFPAQPGIEPVGNGDTLFYDKQAYGVHALVIPTKQNLFTGWDLTTPIDFGWLIKGNPSLPGTFGALYGEGDMRLSIGANMQYLQNLQIGLTYNFYFGDADKNIGKSFLKQNPYMDRDNIGLIIKYSL